MKVALKNEGIGYEERLPDYHIFLAIVKKKDTGKGDLVPVVGPDTFNSAIMAGMFGEVLYIVSLKDVITKLKDVLYGPDQRDAPLDGFEEIKFPGNE